MKYYVTLIVNYKSGSTVNHDYGIDDLKELVEDTHLQIDKEEVSSVVLTITKTK